MAQRKEQRNTLEGEVWRSVPFSNDDYSVSTFGRVYSNRYHRFLPGNKDGGGYLTVRIHKKNYGIHRLVANAYLGFDLFSGMEINHIDGNKENNVLSNIEIVTRKQNMRHAIDNGLHCFDYSENVGPIAKRLRQYIKEALNGYFVDFLKNANLSHGYLQNKSTNIKDETLQKITLAYPSINPEWVRYGAGEMIINK